MGIVFARFLRPLVEGLEALGAAVGRGPDRHPDPVPVIPFEIVVGDDADRGRDAGRWRQRFAARRVRLAAVRLRQSGDQREAVLLDQQRLGGVEKLLDIREPDVGQLLAREILAGFAVGPSVRRLGVGMLAERNPLLPVTQNLDLVLASHRARERLA